MRQLADDLKHMLAGLAYQDVSENLTFKQKLRVLDIDSSTQQSSRTHSLTHTKRIALLAEDKDILSIMDTVIQDYMHLDAQLDVLHIDPLSPVSSSHIATRLQQSNTRYQTIALTDQAAVELSKYIKQHASLAFLVTRQDASHIEALLKKTELLYGSRLPVPLVFINPDKNVAEDVEAAVIPAFQGA